MEFNELIEKFVAEKGIFDKQKKIVDRLNVEIKTHLLDAKIDECDTENYTVSITKINTDKIVEDKLIYSLRKEYPKEICDKIIKTKEYIDLDKLEDLIYNRTVDTDLVDKCIERKDPTIRLNVKKRGKVNG